MSTDLTLSVESLLHTLRRAPSRIKQAAGAGSAPPGRFPAGADPDVALANETGFHDAFNPTPHSQGITESLFRALGPIGVDVYSHLPRIRLLDSVVGAAAGAGVGLLANSVRNLFRSKADKAKNSGYLSAALWGGGLGALGGNIVGDRARRYLSNVINPDGNYAELGSDGNRAQTLMDRLLPGSWDKFYRAAVKDEPVFEEPVTPNAMIGRELVRRQFGVHTDRPETDILLRNRDGSFSINPRLGTGARPFLDLISRTDTSDGPEHDFRSSSLNPRQGAGQAGSNLLVPNSAAESRIDINNLMNGLMGGQMLGLRPLAGSRDWLGSMRDRWDYTLEPPESRYMRDNWWKALTDSNWRSGWVAPQYRSAVSAYSGHARRNSDLFSSLLARELADRFLVYENPWLSQYVRYTPDGSRFRMQHLTGDGYPYQAPPRR